jgi:hypothetical protein
VDGLTRQSTTVTPTSILPLKGEEIYSFPLRGKESNSFLLEGEG